MGCSLSVAEHLFSVPKAVQKTAEDEKRRTIDERNASIS
jgi:hypothetical protein